MTKLIELEKRLADEPDNLGLRVAVGGAMREVGRHDEAVELYRSVALAYRDQGRTQQAIAVCRSILEIAPGDGRCNALLLALGGHSHGSNDGDRGAAIDLGVLEVGTPPPRETVREPPPRRSSYDETPLPGPLPYHIADPTMRHEKPSSSDLARNSSMRDLLARDSSMRDLRACDSSTQDIPTQDVPTRYTPTSEGAITRPGTDDGTLPEVTGLANAARRISATLISGVTGTAWTDEDLAAELDTRQVPRIPIDELELISAPPPTVPVELMSPSDFEDEATRPVGTDGATDGVPAARDPDSDDEETRPREMPDMPRGAASAAGGAVRRPRATTGQLMLASAFFAPVPAERRASVLSRFQRRSLPPGMTVIRQGEKDHALVIVVVGQLIVRVERADGRLDDLDAIAAGAYYGEAALLAREPSPANVVTVGDVELLLLPPRDFYEVAGAFPALWAELKRVAERRGRDR